MSTTPNRSLSAVSSVEMPGDLETRYHRVRRATERLCEPLSPEDCVVQSMPNCSPAKWHLAHTSWFFETFILERAVQDYTSFNPQFRVLFNSYYQSVGEQYSRPQRGLLTRPTLDEVLGYRRHVDHHLIAALKGQSKIEEIADLVELGLNHEQQHQELVLTDVKHLLSHNPLRPAYMTRLAGDEVERPAQALRWRRYQGGIQSIGHEGASFAFDNEQPRHRVLIEPFEIASRAVTTGEYLAFIEDGGYERPEFWLSDGWYTLSEQQWHAPLYWERQDRDWSEFSLCGQHALRLNEPVSHVSFYEADAYARWAGARLPTEAEWESVAIEQLIEGNFIESGLLHPAPGADHEGAPAQMFGDVWEWTKSPYTSYPGFRAAEGALGEYNGKFMCNQMVLRGGSCATPQSHIRATYRNFFAPDSRWQFTGIRLCRDAG
jgi:ergothioneine biosynthesis protein EgtB